METTTQGTLVADRYRLIREIGFGGMGTVWLAYDSTLDSKCALKLIGATQAAHEEFRVRFECEAKCAAQLRGAHVVDVLNRGEWQGKPFMVMEYLEGEDLGMRLDRLERLDPRTTYRIVAQVARALMRAHALGIVHRDIKPGNIFLVPGDDHEIAKVLDFGVAKHRALPNAFDNPLGGQFVGTPCYMSPEQASSGTVDWRSDLWALAVITFECLTGELPFQDESVVDMIVSITRGTVPKITQNRPELPAELEFWWQRATARDPAHRFQSAKEFADALAAAIDVYPMTVSDFPQPNGEALTVLDPLSIMPSSRRPALVAHAARSRRSPYSYETDAAVTMHAQFSSSVSQFKGALRTGRRLSPYVVAGMALCAAVALGAGAWRPTLDGVTGALGFDFASQAPPLPWAAEVRQGAGLSQGDSQISARVPSSPEAVMATAPPPLTLLPEMPEPSVLVVAEPPAPLANSGPPAQKPNVAVRQPNHWRPLAPPAPAPSAPPVVPEPRLERPEKDYGI